MFLMRFVGSFFLLFVLLYPSLAWQQTESGDASQERTSSPYHISDNLYIFMHAGPGRNYRILGSVEAGTAVRKTEKEITNEFVEIVDDGGRQGWIEAEFLSSQPSRETTIAQLQDDLAQVESSISPLRKQLSNEQQINATLQANLDDAQAQLTTAQRELAKIQSLLSKQNHDKEMRTLMVGGGLVAGGALLGVIFVYLPKRRKRNSGWID
jgi:SH3 domain protein